MDDSRCLRRKVGWVGIEYAKLECSNDKRCIGIEIWDLQYAQICKDMAYTYKDIDKDSTVRFFKKVERYGKSSVMLVITTIWKLLKRWFSNLRY